LKEIDCIHLNDRLCQQQQHQAPLPMPNLHTSKLTSLWESRMAALAAFLLHPDPLSNFYAYMNGHGQLHVKV
jgi:hypothetical protein